MSDTEANDHVVIYSSGCEISEDTRTTRAPIEVQMTNQRYPLDPASRLNIGKVHTLEKNQRIIDTGMLTESSLSLLSDCVTDWKSQL